MQCLVIVGKKSGSQEYIEKFIQEKKIPAYFVYRFEESLKIAEVRLLKKNISLTIPQNTSRLFILPENITIDAQNALLKTIEELSEETFIFFLTNTPETLLPTILSRSKIVRVSAFGAYQAENSENDISLLINAKDQKEMLLAALQLCDKISAKNGTEEIERILLALRNEIKTQFRRPETNARAVLLIKVAFKIQSLLPLLSENNVNKKFALETAFLSEI